MIKNKQKRIEKPPYNGGFFASEKTLQIVFFKTFRAFFIRKRGESCAKNNTRKQNYEFCGKVRAVRRQEHVFYDGRVCKHDVDCDD